jgi:hypothetical protein
MSNCVVGSCGSELPSSAVAQYGIEGCDHLSHDRDDDDLGSFVGRREAPVESLEGRIVTAGAERCHVEDVTNRHSTSIDAAMSSKFAAIEVVRCEADQGCDLLAAHLAERPKSCLDRAAP